VVIALVDDAGKFTAPGGASSSSCSRATWSARGCVSDTGSGIRPELLPHVFELFRRDEQAPAGRGLGLAIVRGLVALHGGVVEAASEGPDRGPTFTVTLPYASVAAWQRRPSV
jgi:signal transduction histidine kinase